MIYKFNYEVIKNIYFISVINYKNLKNNFKLN